MFLCSPLSAILFRELFGASVIEVVKLVFKILPIPCPLALAYAPVVFPVIVSQEYGLKVALETKFIHVAGLILKFIAILESCIESFKKS